MYITGTSLYPDVLIDNIATAITSIPISNSEPYWDEITSEAPDASTLYKRVFKSRALVDGKPLICVLGALATTAAYNSTASIHGYTPNSTASNSGLTLGGAKNYTPGLAGAAGTFDELTEQTLFLLTGVAPTNTGVGNVQWHLVVEPTFIALGLDAMGDGNTRCFGYFGALVPLESHPDGTPIICQSTTQNRDISRAYTSIDGPYNYVSKNYYWCQGSYDPFMDIGHTRKLFLRSIAAYYFDGSNTLNTIPLGTLPNLFTSRFNRFNIRVLGTNGFAAPVDTGSVNYLVIFPYPVTTIRSPSGHSGVPYDGFRMRTLIAIALSDYAIVVKYTP